MGRNKRLGLLVLALAALVLSSLACGGDGGGDGKVEPTPIPLGDDTITEIANDARETGSDIQAGLDVVNAANCALGLASCVTETQSVDPIGLVDDALGLNPSDSCNCTRGWTCDSDGVCNIPTD